MNSEEEIKQIQEEERLEYLEHRDVLLAIGVILAQKEGQVLFRYLFKTLEVMCDPIPGLEGNPLHEYLGFMKSGNAIYKLVCEADPMMAATILSKLERERYDKLYNNN